jgi:hypothetical protein
MSGPVKPNLKRWLTAGLLAVLVPLVSGAIWWLQSGHHEEERVLEEGAAAKLSPASYVTSSSCRECHPEQYSTWHHSFHRTMTQQAGPETVVPSFDKVNLHGRGRDYQLSRRGEEFWVNMVVPEWESQQLGEGKDPHATKEPPREDRKVAITTGSHHMQTFWVKGADGLRNVPWFYLLDDKQWITREDTLLRPPEAGPLLPVWNVNCIKCHAVGGVPGLDPATRKFNSKIAELGISCEACHGPAEHHVAYHRQAKVGQKSIADEVARLVNPARCSSHVASQICAQCHSSNQLQNSQDWILHGMKYRPGKNFEEQFTPILPNNPKFAGDHYVESSFWKDGTNRVAGDEFLGHIVSKCYVKGELSCISCHSMHRYQDRDDQLKPEAAGAKVCLSCHEKFGANLAEHTHHAPQSSGSDCYNCHMPHTTYGLLKAIRSHRIDSPSAATTAQTGRPNACNLCHLDKTLEWTSEKLTQWYGQPAVELQYTDKQVAASLRDLLQGDAVQRTISAWHMSWPPALQASGDDWQAPFLARTLDDPYAVARIVAARSLKKLPGYARFEFRYDSDAKQRTRAVAEAIQLWRPPKPARNGWQALLLDEDGKLQQETIDQLLQGRDNRPVEIQE